MVGGGTNDEKLCNRKEKEFVGFEPGTNVGNVNDKEHGSYEKGT